MALNLFARGAGVEGLADEPSAQGVTGVVAREAGGSHPDHGARREWLGRPFDPEAFDPGEFDDNLRNGRLAAFDDEA